ncbi:unnamed protein product [Rotaria sordida]|uniref:Uncharacterized protein n=1 Tax=Rotaria sordida TaxID=392033 RepID=A0A819BW41_9BILA|nr:unnamed protein product [Rotaria sordida]
MPTIIGNSKKSQPNPMISQYEPPTVSYNESSKKKKKIPSSQVPDIQSVNQTFPNNYYISPSSVVSANPLITNSYALQQEQQQQQAQKYIDLSKTNNKNPKHQSTANTNYNNRPYAFSNQNNDHPEAKNRSNNAGNEAFQSEIDDDDDDDEKQPKGKSGQWLSQPLCLGLTRLSGGLLFGSMILLALGSIAGLIASLALYTRDSETNSQWKILGMVICSIMLTTIIATVLIFICCYKHGYMINSDDDIEPIDSSPVSGIRQRNASQTYKFNPTNDASSIRSGILQDVSTPNSIPKLSFKVHDKQTNTETTISLLPPKDFNRGVWPAINAYGGMSHRPVVQPKMISQNVQVLEHEIEEILETPKVIYQAVAPAAAATATAAISPPPVQQRIIHMPDDQTSVIDVVETTKKQHRTNTIREAQKQNIVVQPKPRNEQAHVEEQRTHRIEDLDSSDEQSHHIENLDSNDEQPHRIEHFDNSEEDVDTKKKRSHRIVQKPQNEVSDEIIQRVRSSSIEEIVDVPKHGRKHGRKKDKKQNFTKVSVKHIKPNA